MKDGTISPLFIHKTMRLPTGKWLDAKLYPTKGFAIRKGWHCTLKPIAPHLSTKGRVWIKVEVDDYKTFKRPKSQGSTWLLAQRMKVIKEIKMTNLGQVHFGSSGTQYHRAWDNSIWDDKAKDYKMLANINIKTGKISWWIDKPTKEQKQAVEKYASQFVDDDLLLLELEAEAVLVLQKQNSGKQSLIDNGIIDHDYSKGKSKANFIYEKALEELKYNHERSFCKIIEFIVENKLTEDEKQEYITMLLNDTDTKISLKVGNRIEKNEFKSQAVHPPMLNLAEPKDKSFRGKVVALAKHSANRKDQTREVFGYVYHDGNSIVATDAHQLVVIDVDKKRENTYYAYDGGVSFPNGKFPNYKRVIPEMIKNNNALDLKFLIRTIKGVERVNKFFSKKTNHLPAVKLLFSDNGNTVYTSPQITLKALMSLWLSGVTKVDVSVYPSKHVVFYDTENDKTLAVVMGIVEDGQTLYTPILTNGIN